MFLIAKKRIVCPSCAIKLDQVQTQQETYHEVSALPAGTSPGKPVLPDQRVKIELAAGLPQLRKAC